MKRKVVHGIVAGVAALSVATGGVTYAAFSDFSSITDNSVGAGILRLQLGSDGAGVVPFTFGDLTPQNVPTGQHTGKAVWVASNDGASSPNGALSLTLTNLHDTPGTCAGNPTKALAVLASHLPGTCKLSGSTASGAPTDGSLSRVLSFAVTYYPGIADATTCAATQTSEPATKTPLLAPSRGNLHAVASANGGAGTSYLVSPKLVPGAGVCLAVSTVWAPRPDDKNLSPSDPQDAAAQADSLSFDVRFDLKQVFS